MAGEDQVVPWLLAGDPSIRWQVMKDLAGTTGGEVEAERARVALKGWGRRVLALQAADGRWDGGLYTPKWTSTTYTLLLLRWLGLARGDRQAGTATLLLLDAGLYRDNGINLWLPRRKCSETCATGMVLGLASRFAAGDGRLERLAQHMLEQQMDDGGWNCQRPRGATHSSLHTTINVLEGLLEYESAGGKQAAVTRQARERAHEFLYRHRMFRSHRTGAVIDHKMTRFSFPPQWRYDILRGLDYLQSAGAPCDSRVSEAIELIEQRRAADGTWLLRNVHPGKVHFVMEQPGQPSRWITLRAMRVLRWWNK
jgi:hypothetical protein